MRRIVACALVMASILGACWLQGVPDWALALGILAISAIAWRLSVCPHAGPLALLPATTDIDGAPLPPRWFCDACGKTWPASFDRTQTPKQIFTGHDETKAVNAAKRAEALADRQRTLAIQRAGLKKSKPVPANVTDIRSRRKAAR